MRPVFPREIILMNHGEAHLVMESRDSESGSSLRSTIDVSRKNRFCPPKTISMITTSTGSRSADNSPRMPVRRYFQEDLRGKSSKKRVQFERSNAVNTDDGNNRVKETVYTYPEVTRPEYPLIFWDKHELTRNRKLLRNEAREIVKKRPDLVDSIVCLHGHVHTRARANQFSTNAVMDERTAIQVVSASPGRGLEHFMTSIMCRHRLWVIRKVLSVQDQVRGQDLRVMETKISTLSASLSHDSCLFARNIAAGDECEALSAKAEMPLVGIGILTRTEPRSTSSRRRKGVAMAA